MCGSNPELSPEVNSAKCIGGTALGFAIVTLIGFAIVPWGLVSALAGLFGVIAGSIVCCCGPKAKGEGDGKMNAAGILFIIAAVFHFIAIILPIVGFLILSAAVIMGVVPSQDDAVACELGDVAGDVEPRRVRPADLVVAGVVVEE